MLNTIFNIALDGPSGAGKSSVARAAAKQLGFLYIDTGALYRAVGLGVLRQAANPKDANAVAAALPSLRLHLEHSNGEQSVWLGDEDVSQSIRTPEATMASSAVSAIPAVRTFLLGLQRELAASRSSILDGRDIGTVVLPNAQLKIFLTASAEARAKRRFLEQQAKGIDQSYDTVLANIQQRDMQDTLRETAPLRQAPDAILLDSTNLAFAQTVARVLELVRLTVDAQSFKDKERT